jgi:hypothetical protein
MAHGAFFNYDNYDKLAKGFQMSRNTDGAGENLNFGHLIPKQLRVAENLLMKAYHSSLKQFLVPKGFEKFRAFCVFEVFMSWGLGHEANPKSVKGRPDRAMGRVDRGVSLGKGGVKAFLVTWYASACRKNDLSPDLEISENTTPCW